MRKFHRIATLGLLGLAPHLANLARADNAASDPRRFSGSHSHRIAPAPGVSQSAPHAYGQPNVQRFGGVQSAPPQQYYQRSPYAPPLSTYSPPLSAYPTPRIYTPVPEVRVQPRTVYIAPPVYYPPSAAYYPSYPNYSSYQSYPSYAPPAYYNSAPIAAQPYAETDPYAPVVRYYCQDNQLYYPDTPSCNSNWMRVLVDPQPQ